ncbi:tryptophan--tRNA ligase, partial [Candidatus Collierbacteria bacterium CG10_big_fil_rev_8_21_14_0_10_44_9]
KCVFFRQSDVSEHSQLAVILANFISYGQMKRMHAFKDKLQTGTSVDSINMGLFNYPILMAADILLYKPYGVPVGEDQRQHIELTRDIAESFNKTYKISTFPLPEPIISKEVGRVVGTDGERKMSKSLGNIIGIFEDEKVIEKQIMGSFTDPKRIKATDPGRVEGNPVFIYHDLMNDDKGEVEDLKARYRAGTVGDVEVKQKLVAAHKRKFAGARAKRKELEGNIELVKKILAEGAVKARKFASQTLAEVYKIIGEHNKLNNYIACRSGITMKSIINFDDYSKIEVRVGKIVEAMVPEGSNKLIQFRVDFGEYQKTIFSGIKEWYSPEELVGVKTMWVTNLTPKKTPFGDSEGMLFACDTKDGPFGDAQGKKPYIVEVGDEVEVGSEFH